MDDHRRGCAAPAPQHAQPTPCDVGVGGRRNTVGEAAQRQRFAVIPLYVAGGVQVAISYDGDVGWQRGAHMLVLPEKPRDQPEPFDLRVVFPTGRDVETDGCQRGLDIDPSEARVSRPILPPCGRGGALRGNEDAHGIVLAGTGPVCEEAPVGQGLRQIRSR